MRIPARVRYAVRILVEVGQSPGKPISLPEVERTQRISAKFAKQILQPLIEKNIVGARRGVKGGYFLLRKPSAIRLKNIADALGEESKLAPCLEKSEACDREKSCGARRKWAELQELVETFLAETTIQDFIDQEKAAKKTPPGR
jgi:Rrf2 family protein